MIIPKTINVNEHRIEIIERKFSTKDMGTFSRKDMVIHIDSDLQEDVKAETFLHEIFEVIIRICGIEINHQSLTIMSEMLFSTIRKNNINLLSKY